MTEERAYEILENAYFSLNFEYQRRRGYTNISDEHRRELCVKSLFNGKHGIDYSRADLAEAARIAKPADEFTKKFVEEILPSFLPELRGEDQFTKIPTGNELVHYFATMLPKRPKSITRQEGKDYLFVPGSNRYLMQYIDLPSEVDKVLSKSITCQKLWYLIASEILDSNDNEVIIDQADFMKRCKLKSGYSTEEELEAAVNTMGLYSFRIISANKSTHIRHLTEEADYVKTGKGNRNYIRVKLTSFAADTLREDGRYGYIPEPLYALGIQDGKSFQIGARLTHRFYQNGRHPGKIKIEDLAYGLYTAPDERRQKQLFVRPFLRDLKTLESNGSFEYIRICNHGKTITPEEAEALPWRKFLDLTVEGKPKSPVKNPALPSSESR